MRWRDGPVDPHEDARRLTEELLPTAKLLIERYDEFLPMGALIGPAGELEQVPCSEGIYETTSLAQAELLRQAFARCAEEGELRACALIYEAPRTTSDREKMIGAVTIEIEHFTGYNVTATFAYRKTDRGLRFSPPVVGGGSHRVFAPRTRLAAIRNRTQIKTRTTAVA